MKNRNLLFNLVLLVTGFGLCIFVYGKDNSGTISWKQMLRQGADWYDSEEAIRIGDNLLLFQRASGGWPKNTDMTRVLSEAGKKKILADKEKEDSTLDNGATHTEIRYLARIYTATQLKRFKKGCLRGVGYLLEAQYPNGGWPQFYPLRGGYSDHITFNDDAMIGAMEVLRDIARGESEFQFIDEERKQMAKKAVEKGIDCILKCQIEVNGKLTVWCAQHDAKTFEPQKARSYELPSLSGSESVDIIQFLMEIENPSPEIIKSIESAVAWFDGPAKLTGIKRIKKKIEPVKHGSKVKDYDYVIVKDASAPPMWARFYEIGTNRPFFCSRDGIERYSLAEISHERRTGYSWYGHYADDLLEVDYPSWKKKH